MPETEIIFSVQESPEGGYEARALGYSIFTQADSMDALKLNVREAVRCHFDEGETPPVIRLHLVKDEVISAGDCLVIFPVTNSSSCSGDTATKLLARWAATFAYGLTFAVKHTI
jgi:hypothetical protein